MRRIFLLLGLCIAVFMGGTVSAAGSMSTAAIKITSVSTKNRSVTLRWQKRSGAAGYQVVCYLGSKTVRTVTTGKLSYTFKKLSYNSSYRFRVRAYRKKGKKRIWTSYSSWVNQAVYRSAGKKGTIKELLQTALKPIGTTVYVWKGGHNTIDSTLIGLSPTWETFYQQQTSEYDWKTTKFQTRNGLDCSGYVAWVLYNTFNRTSGNESYIMLAKRMATTYASYGWGTLIEKDEITEYHPGDIMSSKKPSHVYIVVGTCSDGSLVLLHCSPPGVMITGTVTPDGNKESEAIALANSYMETYFPEWHEKFPKSSRGKWYLEKFDQLCWDVSSNGIMSDPEGIRNMSAEEVLSLLFQ